MSEGKFDKAKGRAKEAAGDLTGDEGLEAEGKADRTAGGAKEKFDQIIDKIKEPFRRDH